MIYFDTDFWIHYLVEQDSHKHLLTKNIFEQTSKDNKVFTSLLGVQETVFVLAKLGVNAPKIERIVKDFWKYEPINYTTEHFDRAVELAKLIGFKHINDCLHTAIAETYCQELCTFNEADFKKIQKHTSLKVTIL